MTLLRDGYLYAEDKPLAEALVSLVQAEHLFAEAEIWVQRGERFVTARKTGKRNIYADGPQEGNT